MRFAKHFSQGSGRLAVAAWMALASAGACADGKGVSGSPQFLCRNGAFPGGGQEEGPPPVFALARITASSRGKVHFLVDYGGIPVEKQCSASQGDLCLSRRYLVPGDQVIVSKTEGGLACSWFERKHHDEMVRWLPLSRLEMLPPAHHTNIDPWLGTWQNGDDTITVTRGIHGAALQVEGQAYWPGRDAPLAHSMMVKGHGSPEANIVELVDEPDPSPLTCGVRLSLLGRFLIASDNHRCGGVNVDLDGVYLKRGVRPGHESPLEK